MPNIGDGLSVLSTAIDIEEVMTIIERTARWVDPEVFAKLPVWYPEFARGAHFYNKNWSEPRYNTNRRTKVKLHKAEGNTYANQALSDAMGQRKVDRPNWSCCHIWGIDDPKFQKANPVVKDPRYYSCVANMVLLPTPLKAFTDAVPEVKSLLRQCAKATYSWECDMSNWLTASAEDKIDSVLNYDAYPKSWPRRETDPSPPGVIRINGKIEDKIKTRKQKIAHDLKNAGEHYPREQVSQVLDYWRISLQTSS